MTANPSDLTPCVFHEDMKTAIQNGLDERKKIWQDIRRLWIVLVIMAFFSGGNFMQGVIQLIMEFMKK